MTDKSEWQELNRRLMAEQREKLGDPPTAEEMLAYSRGELSEMEEERIRELLVSYPELARAYAAPFPDEWHAGNPASPPDAKTLQSWSDLQRRLGVLPARRERARFRQYVPTSIAAALALVFFGLYVQAEGRARQLERQPAILGEPHRLEPGGSRGPADTTTLNDEGGEAYLLEPHLINQVRYANYRIELYDRNRAIWTSHTDQPNADDVFKVVIPHEFLRAGERYQLRISGLDGRKATLLGAFDLAAPAE
jgi:hypothetical protein